MEDDHKHGTATIKSHTSSIIFQVQESIGSFAFAFMNLRYTPWGAYGQSKLANLLFAYELDRRCRAKGLSVVANALHPGVVNTELFRYPLGSEGS